MGADRFQCFLVSRNALGEVETSLHQNTLCDLPQGDVLLKVQYSSLNYKDAMAATAHPAIAKTLPHVPGIDAVGTVVQSRDNRFHPGDQVIATGHELGVERWGGWSEYMQSPAGWLVPLPEALSPLQAMTLGTAGFTAAQCVKALLHQGVYPEQGDLVVTGATGGVGSLSVMILAKLGFRVIAVTGKSQQIAWLKSIGAADVIGREAIDVSSQRPLLKGRFAGGIDTVGGNILATLCKMISHRGSIACCGLTAGSELPLTVYPFLLRGLTLCGIDSAWCPDDEREEIWNKLATDWSLPNLDLVRNIIPMSQLQGYVEKVLQGENIGRVVVDVCGDSNHSKE